MSRKREPTDEERALFEAALKDAMPIKPVKTQLRVKPGAAKAKAKPASPRPVMPAGMADAPRPSGLDGSTATRLRKGQLEPEARIDLHGMTEAVAHRALVGFIRGAAARGHRLVLVVTGKGLKAAAPDEPFDLELVARRRGVLRAMAPRWLAEPELVGLVAEMRTAHRRHGGEGALYVYLRKPGGR